MSIRGGFGAACQNCNDRRVMRSEFRIGATYSQTMAVGNIRDEAVSTVSKNSGIVEIRDDRHTHRNLAA
ncbi:MAG TPA: hypothetical protein VGM46_13500 [Mesorhizobium sp.]|jgi:hypothetical protein